MHYPNCQQPDFLALLASSLSLRFLLVATAQSQVFCICLQDDILQGDLGSEAPSCQGMATGLVYDLTHQTGSCMYMAPEIFRGDPYNESVDIFSFGKLLTCLMSVGQSYTSLLYQMIIVGMTREEQCSVCSGYVFC